jgi:hypothetical protein
VPSNQVLIYFKQPEQSGASSTEDCGRRAAASTAISAPPAPATPSLLCSAPPQPPPCFLPCRRPPPRHRGLLPAPLHAARSGGHLAPPRPLPASLLTAAATCCSASPRARRRFCPFRICRVCAFGEHFAGGFWAFAVSCGPAANCLIPVVPVPGRLSSYVLVTEKGQKRGKNFARRSLAGESCVCVCVGRTFSFDLSYVL